MIEAKWHAYSSKKEKKIWLKVTIKSPISVSCTSCLVLGGQGMLQDMVVGQGRQKHF